MTHSFPTPRSSDLVEEFEEHLVLAAAIGLGTAGLNVEPPMIVVPFGLAVPGLRMHRGDAILRVEHRQGVREAGTGDDAVLDIEPGQLVGAVPGDRKSTRLNSSH